MNYKVGKRSQVQTNKYHKGVFGCLTKLEQFIVSYIALNTQPSS